MAKKKELGGIQLVTKNFTDFKHNVLYFIRTDSLKKDGYLRLDGKEYGTGKLFQVEINKKVEEFSKQINDIIKGDNSDFFPELFLYGSLPTTKSNVVVSFKFSNGAEIKNGYFKIKCQGTSSMNYPKKNFTIVSYSDSDCTNLLPINIGWGEQSKYCLKANYMDHTHARNIINAELWSDVVKSRTDYDSLPDAFKQSPNAGAIDGMPIKLYANGIYQGLYTWNIPKDAWAYGMTSDEILNDKQFILGGEQNTVSTFCETSCNFRKTTTASEILNETTWSIEVGNKTNDSAILYANAVNNLIKFIKNTTNKSDFKNGIGDYLDVNSAIDYYIFQYVICGLDSLGKNQLLASYDGKKLMLISYDMDSTWGLNWDGLSFVSAQYKCPEQYEESYNLLYEKLCEFYPEEIKERYSELRNNVLSDFNIIRKFEKFYYAIGKDIYAEETTDTPYTAIPNVNNVNLKQLRNYIPQRLNYVDSMIPLLGVDVPCDGIELSEIEYTFNKENYKPFEITATLIPENTTDTLIWETTNPSIAKVINGTVYLVGTGSCQIKAICGKQTAICNVISEVAPVAKDIVIKESTESNNNQSWKTEIINLNMTYGGYIEAEIDLSTCTGVSENILSIGNNIDIWGSSGNDIVAMHMYYTISTKKLEVNIIDQNAPNAGYRGSVEVSDTIKLKIAKNGVYVNNHLVELSSKAFGNTDKKSATDIYTKLCNLSNVYIGSIEGNTRSNAIYKSIKAKTFEYDYIPCTNFSLKQNTITIDNTNISELQILEPILEPSNTTDGIYWESNNEKVVTIINGILNYEGNGECNINATCNNIIANSNVICNVTGLTTNTIHSDYSPNGNSWSNNISTFNFANNDYIMAKIDLTFANETIVNQNVLSVGSTIGEWGGNNIHFYYTPTNKTLEIAVVQTAGVFAKAQILIDENYLLIKINKNGIFINNELITQDMYDIPNNYTNGINKILALNTFDIGSTQGDNRATTHYNYVKVLIFN